jgi:hypothetical protein
VDLSGAVFILANLTDADLDHADLRGAELYGADFSNAPLTDADLDGIFATPTDSHHHRRSDDASGEPYRRNVPLAPPRSQLGPMRSTDVVICGGATAASTANTPSRRCDPPRRLTCFGGALLRFVY